MAGPELSLSTTCGAVIDKSFNLKNAREEMGFLPQVFLSACMLFTVGFPPVHLTPMGFPPLGFPPLGLLPVGFRLWAVCLWAFQQWASRLLDLCAFCLGPGLGACWFHYCWLSIKTGQCTFCCRILPQSLLFCGSLAARLASRHTLSFTWRNLSAVLSAS